MMKVRWMKYPIYTPLNKDRLCSLRRFQPHVRAFQHLLTIDSKEIRYIDMQDLKKLHFHEHNCITERKGCGRQKKRAKKESRRHIYCVYASWEEKRAERKDAETQKPKTRGEASPRSEGIIIIMARAIIFSLVPTLPDVAASSSNVFPARIASLLLIAAACTFTNLKW